MKGCHVEFFFAANPFTLRLATKILLRAHYTVSQVMPHYVGCQGAASSLNYAEFPKKRYQSFVARVLPARITMAHIAQEECGMSSLISRSAVLTVSRLSNFGIMVLTPLLLVRILAIEDYGRYQEFMVYAMLFVAICGFGVDASLSYFLPRYPDKEREIVTQNSILVLAWSSLCLTALLISRPFFLEVATYDFLTPLVTYVFCFVNLNWLEYYWVAKRRADLVLYYSAARLIVRVVALLVAAYITGDVETILWTLVAVEALRLFLVAIWATRAKLLQRSVDRQLLREVVTFASPIGLSGLLQQGNKNIGKLFIGSMLGAAALAYYSVASYLLPAVRVVIGSVADVVFPELVRTKGNPAAALHLWQRQTVVFCALLVPAYAVLTYYAELFITTLFTDAYSPAIPVFQVYMLWLLRRCLNTDALLRTSGKTGFMLTGNGISVAINLALMVALYYWLGLIGPAIAFIISSIVLEVYYVILATLRLNLRITELLDWRNILRIVAAAIVALPILILSTHSPGPEIIRAILASVSYIGLCWLIAYRLGVDDVGRVARFVVALSRFRNPVS